MLNQRLMPVFFMATMDMDSTVTMDTMDLVAIKNTGISLWFSISRSLSIVVSM